MPFDLSTARPVSASGGFDLSTARPVDASPQERQTEATFEVQGRQFRDPFGSRMVGAQESRKEEEQKLAQFRAEAPKGTNFARDLPEIGEAPELRQLDTESMKRGFAAGLITNEAELANAIKSLTPGAEVIQDPEGKAIIKFPSGGEFAVNKPGLSGQDFVQFATRLVSFIPAGRIVGSSAKQLGKGALAAGATEAGLQRAEEELGGRFDAEEVGIAASLQPVAQAIPSALGFIKRAATKAPESELVKAGKEAGIPVMTSDVLEPKTFAGKGLRETAEKLPVIGTGELRAAQQEFRKQAVDEVAEKYGEFSYDAIIKSLKSQKDKVKRAAGNVLNASEQRMDDLGAIPMNNTKETIAKAKESLVRPGVITSDADRLAVEEVDNLLTTLDSSDQIFSSLRQNRTAFREILKGIDKTERSQMTSRAKSILESISGGMKKDLDSFAGENMPEEAFGKWKKANAAYAEEATKLTRTKLKNILDKGDVTPESVKSMLFSRTPSETKMLYNSLSKDGRKNARSAIISKMFEDMSKRQAGITPNAFLAEMKKNPNQIDAFFKGADKKQLQGLQKVLEATRRAQDASVTTPTGQSLFTVGAAGGAAVMPVETLLTLGSIGGISRLYESAPVRNALLRVASAPQPRIDSEIQKALAAIAHAARGIEQQEQRK